MIKSTQPLILGSSSPARNALLQRLGISFTVHAPNIDETAHPNETLKTTVQRLAEEKANTVASAYPDAVIIACDQLVEVNGHALGKPHTHEKAIQQLQLCSGQTLLSSTALCVLNSRTQSIHRDLIEYRVKFKTLSKATIEAYLQRDKPYFCAGSIKAEGLGITLFESMAGEDYTALIGLPLIKLTQFLQQENIDPLLSMTNQQELW